MNRWPAPEECQRLVTLSNWFNLLLLALSPWFVHSFDTSIAPVTQCSHGCSVTVLIILAALSFRRFGVFHPIGRYVCAKERQVELEFLPMRLISHSADNSKKTVLEVRSRVTTQGEEEEMIRLGWGVQYLICVHTWHQQSATFIHQIFRDSINYQAEDRVE